MIRVQSYWHYHYYATAFRTMSRVARIISTAFATPTLATVDLCTGVVTTGPRLAIGGTDLG